MGKIQSIFASTNEIRLGLNMVRFLIAAVIMAIFVFGTIIYLIYDALITHPFTVLIVIGVIAAIIFPFVLHSYLMKRKLRIFLEKKQ
jgi:hypothetical protein